ncbi:MAG: hypothetical protein LH632_07585 [Rhodoferax sp.]|nr:hypothetical protein [Rhodoferax sp.]
MGTGTRRFVVVILVLVLLVGAGLLALRRWVGGAGFMQSVQRQASAALGVETSLGKITVDLWPAPAIALLDVKIQTTPALTAERLELRPAFRDLLSGRFEVTTLLLHGANLPQTGIDALIAANRKRQASAAGAPVFVQRVVLDSVRWQSRGGDSYSVNADASLDRVDRLPDKLLLTLLDGPLKGARLTLQRQQRQEWDLLLKLGGGTVRGPVSFAPAAGTGTGTEIAVKGHLETRAVELDTLARGKLSGQLEATTTFSTKAVAAGDLVGALQTSSSFTVRNAVLRGMDLSRAVKTVGLSRGGQTSLDSLAGQVQSRGEQLALNNLVASSGVLSANGNITISASRALAGRLSVSLGPTPIGAVVGIPLVLGGTLDAPEVTLTRAAMLGAAVGTMVMPGVGTGAGANLGERIGDRVKGLFGK